MAALLLVAMLLAAGLPQTPNTSPAESPTVVHPAALPVFLPGSDTGGAGRGEELPASLNPSIDGAKCGYFLGLCACVADPPSYCNDQTCQVDCR